MKRTMGIFTFLAFVFAALLLGNSAWGQTSPINESFSNLGPYGGYQTETWTGDDGGTWTATDARTDLSINGKAICIRDGKLTSPTVSGGIGSLTVTTERAYSGGSGDMDVRVNGTSVGSIPYDGTEQTTTINNINVSGDVVIVIDATNSSSDRPKFDDLSWTAYTAGPTITLSESSLTGFSYEEGNGPSAEQTFTLEGSNLTDEITLTAPTNYEISETSGGGFGSSITLTESGGSVTTTTIYARLKSGLSIGTYNNENITASSSGATDQTVTCDGEVTCPSVSAPTATAATSASGTSFTANWDPVSGATGYELDVYSSGGGVDMTADGDGSSSDPYSVSQALALPESSTEYFVKGYIVGRGNPITFGTPASNDYSVVLAETIDETNPSNVLVAKVESGDRPSWGLSTNQSLYQTGVKVEGYRDNYGGDPSFEGNSQWEALAGGGTTYHLQNEDVGNVTSYDVSGLTAGEMYYYLVRAYNDCGSESSNSNEIEVNLSCSDPTTQASTLDFPDTQYDQMDVSWTNGDGDYRLVVASTSPITGAPSDNTSYTADASFGDGDELNTGEFIVYAGSGNSFTMTGLNSDTEYFIKVFEYNCDGGSEQYLTTSPLSDSETTVANIPAVTDFDVTCMTETTATVEWTNPSSGNWDGVIIAIRNSTNPVHTLSDDPATVSADAVFGNGHEFGTTTPYSYLVYKGTGTSITITGLTQGQDYSLKAFSYYGSLIGDETTTSIAGLDIQEVTSASAAAGNSEATVGWTNPDCYDEILVVGKDGGSVTSTPSGDGSAYSADAVFGVGTNIATNEYVVYQGTGSSINVTNLTNDNTYYFKIFTRIGTEWSGGVEVFVVPADVTVLEGGDIAIISVNTQYQDSESDDEWCFISFKDITEGTSIEFTDNGYERETAGLWGDTEGTIRLTRNGGGTIAAGTPICVQGAGNSSDDFTIINCGDSDDENWTISSLNDGSSYDLNSSDQIWVFQNGNWDNPSGEHDADYTGNVVWGWTGTGWEDMPGYSDTKGSTVPPGAECFNNNLDGLSTKGKVAYTGDMSAVTQIEWILRINDPANWTNYDVGDNNDDYNDDFYSNGPDYANTCQTFSINPGGYTHGTWTGQRNTQWFECANWESLVIPDETTDVLFDSDDCSNNIELVAGETAECNDLTLQGTGAYSLWGEGDETKKIEIFGDLTIKNDDLLAFDDFDAGTDDGTIILHGDWINQTGTDGFYQGNSLVVFDGNQSQTISSTETETFHEIKIDKASNNLNLQQNITTSNLEFVNGLLSTDAYSIFIDNTNENALSGHNTNSYINGNLRRAATNAGAYDFPVGDASNYELATVDVTSATSLTHLDAHFATADLGPLSIGSLGLVVDGTPLVSVLDAGYWEIEPNTGASVNYDIEVNLAGSSNAAADAEQHAVIKRDDAGSDWELQGSHDNTTQSINGSVVTAQVSSLSGFSQFAIARSNQFPLAVELTDFDASCQHGHVLLEWTTASEENSDYFRIEYAPDARSWKTIDKVLAFGTTNQQQAYQLLLEDVPETGYFRLSEVDTDGTVTSYKPAYINCSNGEQAEFTLAPNPAKTSTNLKAQNASADFYLVRISDMQGRLVKAVSWENPAEQSLMISLSDLPSGMYNVKVFNESEVQYLKFIVK